MKHRLCVITGLLLIITVLGLAGCEGFTSPPARSTSAGAISSQNTGIWVTGEGKVTVVPDMAMVNLGVEAQATTVAQAQSEASSAMEAVVNELDRGGVDDKDIQTRQYSIYPVRRWDQPREQEVLVGYRVSNTVTVKIREVENTGAIIDAVTQAGGDYIRIDSISFTVEDPSAYHAEAREKAIEDARTKAAHLADSAGVRLGAPTYISESGGFIPVVRSGLAFAEAGPVPAPMAPPPISPGETEITLTVQIAYSIR